MLPLLSVSLLFSLSSAPGVLVPRFPPTRSIPFSLPVLIAIHINPHSLPLPSAPFFLLSSARTKKDQQRGEEEEEEKRGKQSAEIIIDPN